MNFGGLLKKAAAAGGRALLKKFGHEAEKKVIQIIEDASDAGKDKATVAVTKAFDSIDRKAGIGGDGTE